MDKNAFTEQRRKTVINLLQGMDIKKEADDSFNKNDVYECMQRLCDIYENNIKQMENAYEGALNEYSGKYKKYYDDHDLYSRIIMEAKKSSDGIINEAKKEVEIILSEGKERVEQQELEIEQMLAEMDDEKQKIIDELNAIKQAKEVEEVAMYEELAIEKEKMTSLKNKCKLQSDSMDEQFKEIEISILQIAEKMDGIKGKLTKADSTAEGHCHGTTIDLPVCKESAETEMMDDIFEISLDGLEEYFTEA